MSKIPVMRTVTGRSTTVYIRTDLLEIMDKIVEATGGTMNRSEIVNAALDSARLETLLHSSGLTVSNS